MKLCFNTIACRNSGSPLLEDLNRVADLGRYGAIELWSPDLEYLDDTLVGQLVGFCGERRMELPVISTFLGVMGLEMDDRARHIDLCRRVALRAVKLGAKYVRTFPGKVGKVTSRAPEPVYYGYLVDSFRTFCRILADSGLTLLSETHRDTMVDTASGAKKFITDVGETNHGLILQLGIVPRWSGMNAVDFYHDLSPLVKHMHLHPYPLMEHPDNPEHYASLLPVLREENPDFFISVENCDGHVPPLETAVFGADLIEKLSCGLPVDYPDSDKL